MTLAKSAYALTRKGFSVVAVGADKRAIVAWKPYQQAIATHEQVAAMFAMDKCKGLAVICGKVSGNLEVIDIDCKYDITGTLFENLMAAIHEVSAALSDKLVVMRTRSGGYHLYYRCEVLQGNQKLAQRHATDEERKENPNEKVKVLVETRGEAGYVVAPPTEGYEKVGGGEISEISPSDRDLLLEVCRSFNQYIIEEQKPAAARAASDKFAVTPWEDYNNRGVEHMLGLLEGHGWIVVDRSSDKVVFKRPGNSDSRSSGDYCYSKNLFAVFTTSSEFEPQKGYKPAAVFAKLECRDNFKDAARKLSELGYGEKPVRYDIKLEREVFQRKKDGYTREDLAKLVADRKVVDMQQALTVVDQLEKQWGDKVCAFWDVETDKDGRLKVHINRTRFIEFLHEVGGFGLYFYDANSTIYRIIRSKDGFVEEASTEQMKKFIMEYIDSLPDTFDGGITPEWLKELVMKQYNSLFTESFLEFCERATPDFLKDEHGKAYFAFKNGVVVVTKEDIQLVSYGSLGKHIWRSQVIDFPVSIDQDFEVTDCEFFQFIEKISGDDRERWTYCLTLIGYLLHKYKDPATPYAVILAEETENEADGGGTGKGILVKAISYLMNTERVDGKNFKLDKNFAFQRVNLDTRLVSIEDVRKNVDFEGFFSIITEGITVEKKNKDELYIPFKDAPKILFTTNYTIQNNMAAAKRRQKVFEFAGFFGPSNTPRDFFGHNLFDEWDQDEWNRFYNLMFACVNMFLAAGIKEVVSGEKIKRKHIKLTYGEEGLEYWDNLVNNDLEKWKPVKEMYAQYLNEYDLDKKYNSLKKFKKMLDNCCSSFGMTLGEQRNWQAGGATEYRVVKGVVDEKSCGEMPNRVVKVVGDTIEAPTTLEKNAKNTELHKNESSLRVVRKD